MKTSKKTTREQNRSRLPGRRPEGWEPIDKGTPLQVLLKTQMTRIGAALSSDGDGPPLSTHEVAERSGGRVSANTVSLLLRGRVAQPSAQTIQALAVALEVTEDDLWRAAAGSHLTLQLPAKAGKLSPDGWRDLLRYLDFLLDKEN